LVTAPAGAARRWLTARSAGGALLLVAVLLLLPYMGSGTELVRLRNALSLGPDLALEQDWVPPTLPPGYLAESAPPAPFFVSAYAKLGVPPDADEWARAKAIASHLLGSAPVLMGGAIQGDLRDTYQGIVRRGDGYCGDFVRAFAALGGAAGLTLRTWAFSFDGYGGHGHIWVEVWNSQRARWQLLDVFDNYYFVDGSEEPLSALAFRTALMSGSKSLQLRLINPQARPGYVIEAKAWDYFRRGLTEWYAPWGNNVFAQDSAALVRVFSGVSRTAGGLGAWASGVQPQVRMLPFAGNEPQRNAMRSLRQRLMVSAGLAGLGLLLIVLSPFAAARARLSLERPATAGGAPAWPRVCIVGPLPPPSGGMANQCEQLQRLLGEAGADVSLVRTNAPYRPAFVGGLPVIRAGFRLLPYLVSLWRGIGRAQVVHVFANSGWAWHLLVAPALVIARLRGVPAIVNYRGGLADDFISHAPGHVLRSLARASLLVTPSGFLRRVFAKHGLAAQVIPNIVDLTRFQVRPALPPGAAPHLVVTRNLERIYDIPTALRAFSQVQQKWPQARLTVAGSGPEKDRLQALATELGIAAAVRFAGRIDNAHIAPLYASADVMLNPSTADNMPISILEALASGVPVVSTDAGGIPDLVKHGETAMMFPVGDDKAMAAAVLRVLEDDVLRHRLRERGIASVARFAWPQVQLLWQAAYWQAAQGGARHPSPRREPHLPR